MVTNVKEKLFANTDRKMRGIMQTFVVKREWCLMQVEIIFPASNACRVGLREGRLPLSYRQWPDI